MKVYTSILSIISAALLCISCAEEKVNHNYMWFDCEANYATLSHPDSIQFYLAKCKELGFENVVVDVKSIMGEVLYDSQIAPYMGDWEGVTRSRDYDMLGYFIEYGHQMGMKVFGSLNVFAGGHNYFDRGIIYEDKADWQSICYHQGKLTPISQIKTNYNGMMNPGNPEVRQYQIDVLKEFALKYPEVDGLIFDRVRYDEITSDFSELSKKQFEEYAGVTVENFPEDILSWYDEDGNLRPNWAAGKHFKKWVEYRAMVIHDFVVEAHKALKEINPDLIIGDYTGAWYPTYFQVGVNWASETYDPSQVAEYQWWATEDYHKAGYAEQLDVYMTGLYYSFITKDDVDKATGVVGQRSEAGMDNSLTYCYSVEGGAEIAKEITKGVVPVIGSIYVEQYLGDFTPFGPAVTQALKSTDGVMIFDIVHLNKHKLWDELEAAMNAAK
ncbi:MAG: family 10 glycosylhydrolase [Bacteroidales bacterium]|nr:family 10 glycosylhydrolase [Bacteroidales bacterium]